MGVLDLVLRRVFACFGDALMRNYFSDVLVVEILAILRFKKKSGICGVGINSFQGIIKCVI